MVGDLEVFLSTFLLFLGITALVMATVAGYNSVRGARARAVGLAMVGIAALVGMTSVLWKHAGSDIWGDMVWPLVIMLSALGAGVLAGAGLVYILVAAR